MNRRTLGQRVADAVAAGMGSWRFVLTQTGLILVWVLLNGEAWVHADPYPFILLNLCLSLQAAYAAPLLQMSANRQSAKDRKRDDTDFRIDLLNAQRLKRVERKLDELLAGRPA